jgi:hypothetical protein
VVDVARIGARQIVDVEGIIARYAPKIGLDAAAMSVAHLRAIASFPLSGD